MNCHDMISYKLKLKKKNSCNETHSLNVALTYCGHVMQYVTIDSGSGLCHAIRWCQAIMCTLFCLLNGRWNSANLQISHLSLSLFLNYLSLHTIDLIHKSHNVPVLYPTMRNRNVHISILNGVLWDMELVHCGICEIALLMWLVSQLQCELSKASGKNTWLSFSCKMTSQWFLIFFLQT